MTAISKSKTVKTVLSALWWIVLISLAILLVTVFSAKLRGEVPKVFGYSVMRIVSGSMEPKIKVGEYILVKECAPDEVEKGDIISFYSRDPAIYGIPNTHRVVAEPIITDEGFEYVTRGDASTLNDKQNAHSSELIGKYVCTLGAINAFSGFLGGGAMLVILMLIELAFLAIFLFSFFKKQKSNEDGDYETAEEKLKKEAIAEYLAAKADGENNNNSEN